MKGPWVWAYRPMSSESGSSLSSRKASGIPGGSAVPNASRRRPASSIEPFIGGLRAEDAQQIGGLFDTGGAPLGCQVAELGLHFGDGFFGKQLPQFDVANEFGEQFGVEGERRRAPFSQWRIAFIEECRNVREQQGARERAR